MTCYSPMPAYKTGDGSVIMVERKSKDVRITLSLPCGQCLGCRLERSRQWAMRCMHEASLHKENAFVTLTYDERSLPPNGSLQHADFQKFMKRFRKVTGADISYYMCGEYGPLNWRPHFHACIFGYDFQDKEFFKQLPSGFPVYNSALLNKLWPFGFSSVGDVTFESAAYVARYCVQKITGKNADLHYRRFKHVECGPPEMYMLTPEYNRMSLKKPIGKEWYKKWKSDIYPHDYVIVDGQKVNPPKYYDKLYKGDDPVEYDRVQFERERRGRANYEDNTPERLVVKETVQRARAAFLKRNLEC